MSEFASVVATTEGQLHLYAGPGINSHGDARAGWGIKGGAEVEWTGEQHDSLTVRYEDAAMAKTIRAMLVERFPTRQAMLAAITETRGVDGKIVRYQDGVRFFTEEEAGPQFEAVNELLRKLPTFPWCNPATEVEDEIIEKLVAQHLWELETTFTNTPGIFDGVSLKVISSVSDLAAARAAAWDAAWAAASNAARAAAWDAARDAARAAARAAAWAAARDAARAAAWDAVHMIANIPHNPWAPLVEIMALGCIPIGVVGDEFVVWKPEQQVPDQASQPERAG